MNKYLNLLTPINKRVELIKEELFEREIHKVDLEEFVYGKFEEAFRTFKNKHLDEGIIGNKEMFFNDRINELNNIALSIEPLQDKIFKETGDLVKFHSILFKINNIVELTHEKINDLHIRKTVSPTKKSHKKSYQFIIKPPKDNELYKALKKKKLISNKTSYNDFIKVFSGNLLTKITTPIIWGSENATELLFFILELIDKEIIEGKERKMDYERLKKCFVKINETPFEERFKSLKTDIEFRLSSDKQRKIKSITSTL